MIEPCHIRRATIADAEHIAALIASTAMACCFNADQSCPEWFQTSVRPAAITDTIGSIHMVWLVAMLDLAVVGVVAVSAIDQLVPTQVKYFFVDTAHQGLGIGKALRQEAVQRSLFGNSITVRSSLCAVPVYQRLGFVAQGAPGVFNGLHYQTMAANRD